MSSTVFLVVIDRKLDAQPALDRAIQSAEFTHGRLHLFQSVFSEEGANDENRKRELLREAGVKVLDLAAQVVDAGLEVSIELVWNENWGQAIIDSAERNNAFMVFKSSYIHNQAERSKDQLEWTLLRQCPCPVLIMHDNSRWENRRVLAAINLATTDEAHRELNQQVIDIALTFRESYGSDVHFINAISEAQVNATSADDDDLLIDEPWLNKTSTRPVEITKTTVKKACQDIDDEHIHLKTGNALDAILETAEAIEADLIIVGTVARDGIKGRIIGNMPEKLLDRTACDILSLSKQSGTYKTAVPFS